MTIARTGSINITITHPFLHDFASDDESFAIEDLDGDPRPYVDLSLKPIADSSLNSILTFEKKAEEQGVHELKTAAAKCIVRTRAGVGWIAESMPPRPSLLEASGPDISWVPAEGDDMLYTSNGFFPISSCEDSCGN